MLKLTDLYKKQYKELNKILNEWDPLYVVPENVKDEYTDLINPILNKLQDKPIIKELASFIFNFMDKTYGIKPAETEQVAEKIMKWCLSENVSIT